MRNKTSASVLFGVAMFMVHVAFGNNGDVNQKQDKTVQSFSLPRGVTEKDYVSKTIIFKLKPQYRNAAQINAVNNEKLRAVFHELGTQELGKIYPRHTSPLRATNALGQEYVDLSLIYELNYTNELSIEKAINKIIATGTVVYAEPRYIHYEHDIRTSDEKINSIMAAYNPNDPDLTNGNSSGMYYISRIKCPDAWGINTTTARGDTNVVIGIVDSGTDIDHPDLKSKIKYNYNDPINGTDDDKDGYVDNYRGWDLSENDNDPNVDNSNHGSHVSGCAAAATNNSIGVASPGFNCKFLGVKCSKKASTTQINNGYEGITYAADHGCQIINCSWGGPGGGQYGQDVVSYATINKNALVVASAGNANNQVSNFPGAFEWVLCVASTTSTDAKSSFSTYGYFVDVSSPGSAIRSTVYNNNYTNMDGTSMASPICAGAAAIVKSYFPSYTGMQVGEQLRATTDNIYSVGSNSTYKDKLGTGRINLYRALTESKPSVRMAPIKISDGNDQVFIVNDTLIITGKIINYLAATTGLTATLSTTNTDVTILNSTINAGALNTLAFYDVTNTNAYKVLIKPSASVNEEITFKLTFQDGSYTDSQFFEVTVNVDYINIAINDVRTTNTSRSRVGWNNSDATAGLGFVYKDSSMLYEAGLMIGVSASKVSDNLRGSTSGSNDQDFTTVMAVKQRIPAVKSEFDTYGIFNDNGASSKIGVEVVHKSYAWSSAGDRKYVIFEYIIKNKSGSSISNLYAGMMADWDITDKTSGSNKGATDNANKTGYIYSTIGSKLYGGMRLLTNGPFLHYAIDNTTDGGGGVVISDQTNGYATSEKFTTLSTNRATAGGTAGGNDVINVVSSGPFTVANNDSVTVAFALIAGDDLDDLINSGKNAKIKYDGVITSGKLDKEQTGFLLKQNYPNPVNSSKTTIEFSLPGKAQAELNIYNNMGQKVMTVLNSQVSEGTHQCHVDISNFSDGFYYYELKAGENVAVMKMIVQGNRK